MSHSESERSSPPRLRIQPERQKPNKVRATFNLPRELLDEARNTVVALAGPPHRLTLAKLVEQALRTELERLQADRPGTGRNQPFPSRSEEVRTGRPIT